MTAARLVLAKPSKGMDGNTSGLKIPLGPPAFRSSVSGSSRAFSRHTQRGEKAAQAPPEVLLRGQQVYAASCAVCHGPSGDGNGMAAHMFRVRPRSFREGIFKFRSTPFGSLPTDDDLLRSMTSIMANPPDCGQGSREALGSGRGAAAPHRASDRGLSTVSPARSRVPSTGTAAGAPVMVGSVAWRREF